MMSLVTETEISVSFSETSSAPFLLVVNQFQQLVFLLLIQEATDCSAGPETK
jgi:hypothetical protein